MSRRLAALVVVVVCCCAFTSISFAASIGLNFTATRFGGGPYPILPNETAGIVPQNNWNNSVPIANGTTAQIASPLAGKLVDSNGTATNVQVIWANANAEVNSSGGNLTPNERLYRGTIEGSFFMAPDPQLSVTVSNIPYPKYEVIAYLAGFSFAAESSVKLGSQEFFYIQSSNFTTDGFVKATATNYADRKLATYAVFDNLTDSAFTMEIIKQGGNRAAIAGLQVVQLPEPSSFVLTAIGGLSALGLWCGRRIRHRTV